MRLSRKAELTVFAAGLAVILTLACSLTAYAAYMESPWIYEVNEVNDSITIVGYTGEETECEVPWAIADKEIKNIKGSAFAGTNIKTVTITRRGVGIDYGTLPPGVKIITPDGEDRYQGGIISGDGQDGDIENINPVRDTEDGTSDSTSGSSGSYHTASDEHSTSQMGEVVIAPPDAGYELEKVPTEKVEVSPAEEKSIMLFASADGQDTDIFDMADAEADKNGGQEKMTKVSSEPVDAETDTEIAKENAETAEKTAQVKRKTIGIIVAASLVIIAIAAAAITLMRKRKTSK